MRIKLFDSFADWTKYSKNTCLLFIKSLYQFIYLIIIGIISGLVYIFKQIELFCKREIIAAFIVGALIVILSIGWLFTYINYKTKLTTVQQQRDTFELKLSNLFPNSVNNINQ